MEEAPILKVETKEVKPKLAMRVVAVDTDPALVVKWTQEGRELYFDDEESFLELEAEVVAQLSKVARMRYDLAKNITLGQDVVETVEDGARGWARDYSVAPGSATSRTHVSGKDPDKDYYIARADSVDYHMNKSGFKVTRDPKVTMGGRKETCTTKTVGGQRDTESVLLERPKHVMEKIKSTNARKRAELTKSTTHEYAEKAHQSQFEYGQSMENLGR